MDLDYRWSKIMSNYEILLGILCFAAGCGIAFWVKGRIVSHKVKAAEGEA